MKDKNKDKREPEKKKKGTWKKNIRLFVRIFVKVFKIFVDVLNFLFKLSTASVLMWLVILIGVYGYSKEDWKLILSLSMSAYIIGKINEKIE